MMKRKTLYAVVYTVVFDVHIVMRLLWANLARGQLVKGDTNGERSRRLINVNQTNEKTNYINEVAD